jgi:hypothetical protein
MQIVAIAWIYVVLMMAVAEAMSPQGTLLGAGLTLLLYGVVPLTIVLYILGTPGRRRARRRAEQAAWEAERASLLGPVGVEAASATPDRSSHAAGAAVAAEREES